MSETPDVAAEDFEEIDAELPDALPEEAPEADVIEQSRDARAAPEAVDPLRAPRPDPAIDEADEADRQEQAEVVTFDEDDETR